jgi:hypothetical protein
LSVEIDYFGAVYKKFYILKCSNFIADRQWKEYREIQHEQLRKKLTITEQHRARNRISHLKILIVAYRTWCRGGGDT